MRIVEKPGFVQEGTRRDDAFLDGKHVNKDVYTILRKTWTW